MFDDMDSKALFGSEVFRNLINIEAQKEAQIKKEAENLEKSTLQEFEDFQKKVNASSVLKDNFKKLQQRFINEPEYRKSINQDFVQGVLLLSFED
jgi:hypothetical protein